MNSTENLLGTTAGRILEYLSKEQECDIIKLKFALKLNNSLLFLGLGWLAREDKIVIIQSKNTYLIKLKKM